MITVFVFKTPTKGKVRSRAVTANRKIDENPLVQFEYPSKRSVMPITRQVRLIAADDKYLIGLEIISAPGDKPKHQFKKFRRDRMAFLRLKSFNPSALL